MTNAQFYAELLAEEIAESVARAKRQSDDEIIEAVRWWTHRDSKALKTDEYTHKMLAVYQNEFDNRFMGGEYRGF